MARDTERQVVERLTSREREVLELLRLGLTNGEIAERLGISSDGAKYHVSEIIGKLGVRNRYEASAWPERRPWWMATLAPAGILWRRTRGAGVARLPSLALGVSLAIMAAMAAAAGLILFFSLRDTDDTSTPPSGALVFRAEANLNFDLYRVNLDGSGLVNITNSPGFEGSGTWSPSGETIAFTSDRGGESDIYVMNEDGSGLRNITNSPNENSAFSSWSPDGSRILFSVSTDADGPVEYWVMDADGTNPELLFPRCTGCVILDWSPDGSRLVGYQTEGEQTQLFVINSDGSNVRKLADLANSFARARWSPDGSIIAYGVSKRAGTGGEVWLINDDGSGQRMLYERSTNAISWSSAISWSPGGESLAIDALDQLVVADIGSSDVRVIAEGGSISQPEWSPTGDYIAYSSDREGNREVYVVPQDGGVSANVSNSAWEDVLPRWSPSGDQIIFRSDRDSRDGIYWVQRDGSEQTLLIPASPDGTMEKELEETDIRVTEGGCSEPLALSPPGSLSMTGACQSPDGTMIADVVRVEDPRSLKINVIEMATGQTRAVSPPGIRVASSRPAWSPDSSRVAFYAGDESGTVSGLHVYLLDVNTGVSQALTPGDSEANVAQTMLWSEDGAYLYYTQGGCMSVCRAGFLYRIRADGTGEPEQISDLRVGEIFGFVP